MDTNHILMVGSMFVSAAGAALAFLSMLIAGVAVPVLMFFFKMIFNRIQFLEDKIDKTETGMRKELEKTDSRQVKAIDDILSKMNAIDEKLTLLSVEIVKAANGTNK